MQNASELFATYCGEVEQFYEKLLDFKRDQEASSPKWWNKAKAKWKRRNNFSSSSTEDINRWLAGAQETLSQREATLAGYLASNPTLLSALLHAFDRGDETYFLYLTGKVEELGRGLWGGELTLDKLKHTDQVGLETRLVELKTERKAQREDSEKEKLQKEIDACQSTLRRAELIKKVDSWRKVVNRKDEDTFEDLVYGVLTEYFTVTQLEYQVASKYDEWRSLADREREAEEDSTHMLHLAREIESLNDSKAEAEKKAISVREALTARLFSSPKEQCKLALLLGLQPSRWLREEEAVHIEARRQWCKAVAPRFDKPSNDVSSSAKPSGDPIGGGATQTPPCCDEDFNQGSETVSKTKDKGAALGSRVFTGLCLSGGGIRSATFNLGVLQALAELRLLKGFDYLSTVSGGSYIHQWLAAWLYRESTGACTPDQAFETVNKALVVQPLSPLPGIEATQISFLRRFSNYLIPELGVFSADTWTLFSTWARNTFLNQLVLFSGLLALLALLRALLSVLEMDVASNWPTLAVMGVLAFVVFAVFICLPLFAVRRDLNHPGRNKKSVGDGYIVGLVGLLLTAALLYTGACLFDGFPIGLPDGSGWKWLYYAVCQPLGGGLLLVFTLWPPVEGLTGFARSRYSKAYPGSLGLGIQLGIVLSGAVAGVIVFVAIGLFAYLLEHNLPGLWNDTLVPSKNVVIHGLVCFVFDHPCALSDLVLLLVPPLLVAGLFLCSVLHVGLNKRVFFDEVLEWMARLRSWGFLVSLSWVALIGCLVLGGPILSVLGTAHVWSVIFSVIGWLGFSNGGAFAAKGGVSSSGSTTGESAKRALVGIAPFIFMAGVFVAVSMIVAAVTDGADDQYWIALWLLFGGSAAVFGLFGWRVDINELSMFSFYRNRLARCYQGASVIERKPDPFTGFSVADREVRLGQLLPREKSMPRYPGPFPIFCCTVNFTSGEDLAWQERKGASFAYTPLYSGYDIPWNGIDRPGKDSDLFYNGFRDTHDMGKPYGPGLADVCAISGAAVSPNAGYHTSPSIAFLMTCFNFRLGVWARNTRYSVRDKQAKKQNAAPNLPQSPGFAPWHLVKELFGQTNAKEEFLYLSDGGHFDNMGLYELVRRECRYIVVCDAEEDGELKFEGIAMALRKCRTDFGAEIDLDLRAMRRAGTTDLSAVHCVVGTILYRDDDPETPKRDRSKIVYIKSTLTGSEPADLLSYRLKHPRFPHDTTADQFFSESQFESYRVLGHYIAMTCFSPAVSSEFRNSPLEHDCDGLFKRLYDIWYPVTPAIEQHMSGHGARIDAIFQEIRSKDGYEQLATEFVKQQGEGFGGGIESDQKAYFDALAISLFDFIWRVFNDLDLQMEANRRHPHGEIWMNTFRRWTEMEFMREAWVHHRKRFPTSFWFFLGEHLDFRKPGGKEAIEID